MSHKSFRWFTTVILVLTISLSGITPARAAPPANDDFANAQPIASLPFNITLDLTEATAEPGEPQECTFPNKNVWYSFTPAEDMTVRVDTIGSTVSGGVGVFLPTGPTVADLSLVACAGTGSSANFHMLAGQTYYVRVDVFFGQGTMQLNMQQIVPPGNDDFANAEAINSLPFDITANTTDGTAEPDEPQFCNNSYRSLWYSFTPLEDMSVKVTAFGNSMVSIFLANGPSLNDLSIVGCAYNNSTNVSLQAGQAYYVRLDSQFGQEGLLRFTIEPITPPANDNFANAQPISSLPFNANMDNTDATVEVGEPQNCSFPPFRTLWYTFTASENTAIKIDMIGSPVASTVAIFLATGPQIADLAFLGCGNNNSSSNFQLDAGQTYYFRVDSFGQPGSLQLNIEEIIPPANDRFDNAQSISTLPFNDSVDNTNASAEFGERFDCSSPFRSLWYSFTAAQDTILQVSSPTGSTITIYSSTGPTIFDLTSPICAYSGNSTNFQVHTGQTYYLRIDSGLTNIVQLDVHEVTAPANDDFANAEPITSLPFLTVADNANASAEPGEGGSCSGVYRSLWYSFTPAQDMAIRVETSNDQFSNAVEILVANGPTISDLTSLGCAFTNSTRNLQVQAGQTYYLRLDSFGQPTVAQISIQQIFPPANDDFANAQLISSLPFNITADMTDATAESGEPIGCGTFGRSLWYSFSPTEDMTVRVNTAGSNSFSVAVSVFEATGPSLADLSFMTCAGNTSVYAQMQAGKTYYLRLDSFNQPGIFNLNLEKLNPPVNDTLAGAEVIDAVPFNTTVDISDAITESNEPQNCGYMPNTVWYTFTPTETQVLRADTLGSPINGNVNIYRSTGIGFSGLQFIQCAGGYNFPSFTAQAGQTYYLQVGSPNGQTGTINLHLVQPVPPVNDNFANATDVTTLPFSATANIIDATSETDEPEVCYGMLNTTWYSVTATQAVKLRADTLGSEINANVNVYHAIGSGFAGLEFLGCSGFGSGVPFITQAGETYYFQVGGIGQTGTVQFNLSEVAVITGRVTDALTGTPLPGDSQPNVVVNLYRICGSDCLEFVNSQYATSEGVFFFDSYFYGTPLPTGSYQISVSANLYRTKAFGPFEFTGTSLDTGDLPINPSSVIRGRAVDSISGNPIQGMYAILQLCDGTTCSTFVGSQFTDGNGQFEFNNYFGDSLPAGTYDLEFFASLYQTKHVQVTIGESEILDLGDVLIDPTPLIGSISGRVVDAMTGQPISQDFVPRLNLYRCEGLACTFINLLSANGDGTFRFETDNSGSRLRVGTYRIYAEADQYFSTQVDDFEVGENMDWDVGDIKLNSTPVRFANLQPCSEIPASGGDCIFSVRIYNGTDRDLIGKSWSLASASLSNAFAGYTNFQIKDAQDLDLGKGRSKVFRFRLNIPANPGPYGTYVCTRIFVGEGNQALFNTVGYRDLFCVLWNAGGFIITAAQETPSTLQINNLANVSATEVEPNNSCQGAQDAGAFSDPFVMNGNLDSSEAPDVDFFRFTGTPNQAITLDLEGASTGKGTLSDPFLGVFDSNCHLLYANDDSGSLNSHLEINIPADGVFVVAATTCCDGGFEGGGNGSYQLTVAPLQVIGSIRGMVTDVLNGRPLSGNAAPFAFVRLLRCEQSGCWDLVAQNAGSDGSFRFDQNSGVTLRPGDYMIIAAADQYQYTQTEMFTVEADENYNAGSIALTSYPIRFSDTQICSVPSNGGFCDFSVKITNGLATKFVGKAWSMIDANNIGSFTNFTSFQTDSGRDISLDPGRSMVLRFRFQVRGSVADGAVICTTAFVGQKPGIFFNVTGLRNLFCFTKGVNGFTLMSEQQVQEQSHRMEVQQNLPAQTPLRKK